MTSILEDVEAIHHKPVTLSILCICDSISVNFFSNCITITIIKIPINNIVTLITIIITITIITISITLITIITIYSYYYYYYYY